MSMFRPGERVWFRGKHATEFSLRGEITETISVGPGVRYGVRLENGNHIFADPDQVRERGNMGHPRRVWLGDVLGPVRGAGCCARCHKQFLSRNCFVWVRGIDRIFCSERCAKLGEVKP